MRRTVISVIALALVTACGPSEQELSAVIDPIDDVVSELESFRFKIEGGLTYGDIRSEWPSVSAAVRADINDFDDLDFSVLDEAQADAAELAVRSAASAHDLFGLMAQAVGDYIQQEGDEDAITRNVLSAFDRLDDARGALDELEDLLAG